MPSRSVATPAPTWDPSKLAAGSLDSRRAAVHQLAERLAEHPGSATFRVIPLPEQSLAVRLLAELAEAADAAHDSTTLCCVLSCVANLRLVGLPTVDIARVCSLVVHHASGEPETRAFACAAAYNLSQEPWVLETLSRVHVDAGEPLSARSGDPPEVARHARAAFMRMRRQRWGWLRRAGCARWLACAVLLGLLLCAVRSGAAAQEEPAARLIAGEETREETAARTPPPTAARHHHNNHSRARAAVTKTLSPPHSWLEVASWQRGSPFARVGPPRAGLLSLSNGEPESGRISPRSPSISSGRVRGEAALRSAHAPTLESLLTLNMQAASKGEGCRWAWAWRPAGAPPSSECLAAGGRGTTHSIAHQASDLICNCY